VQTAERIPDDKFVSENLYLSEQSKLVRDHDERFSSEIPSLLALSKDSLILEIGCGDGFLLKKFRQKGFKNLIGVEPSIHVKKEYASEIIVDFFNADVVKRFKERGIHPDCVIANYVVELIPDLDAFFSNLANLMKKGSFLITEVPYLINFLDTFRIDGFAHLICNWFTVNSLIYVFLKHDLEIVSIENDIKYRGGTLRVIAKKEYSKGKTRPAFLSWTSREIEKLNRTSFRSFRDKMNSMRDNLKSEIMKLVEKKIPIYGYGGGLKASTLINWLRATSKEVKMIVDIDPNKNGRMIPIAKIPIKPVFDLFNQEDNTKMAVIIFALDHVDEVETLLLTKLKKGSLVVHLLPQFRVVTV